MVQSLICHSQPVFALKTTPLGPTPRARWQGNSSVYLLAKPSYTELALFSLLVSSALAASCSSILFNSSIFCFRAAGVQCLESIEGCFVHIFFMSVGVNPEASSSAMNESAAFVLAYRALGNKPGGNIFTCCAHRMLIASAMSPMLSNCAAFLSKAVVVAPGRKRINSVAMLVSPRALSHLPA